ncbi:hypothetical protein DYB30_010443 [Aphanomyces astaci]|uniref:Peptidase M14 carboxypeptidase A domain-containing protein n=2 Tax=Aphanomyces astaci TaxID=112090 RepID=A0A397CWS5_APHAT|nr:hypothetical protein DYB30_010443 [Aphanomyces astaci]RHZ25196.1 hypothetical protein DYB31_010203 [Aphanomyces astaci]
MFLSALNHFGKTQAFQPGLLQASQPGFKKDASIRNYGHSRKSKKCCVATIGILRYRYGDTTQSIGNGEDEKFERLSNGGAYTGQTVASFDPVFGAFDDYLYLTYQKPVLTIEVAGSDFVAPVSTIRTRGKEIFKALTQFAVEVQNFDVNNSAC